MAQLRLFIYLILMSDYVLNVASDAMYMVSAHLRFLAAIDLGWRPTRFLPVPLCHLDRRDRQLLFLGWFVPR